MLNFLKTKLGEKEIRAKASEVATASYKVLNLYSQEERTHLRLNTSWAIEFQINEFFQVDFFDIGNISKDIIVKIYYNSAKMHREHHFQASSDYHIILSQSFFIVSATAAAQLAPWTRHFLEKTWGMMSIDEVEARDGIDILQLKARQARSFGDEGVPLYEAVDADRWCAAALRVPAFR